MTAIRLPEPKTEGQEKLKRALEDETYEIVGVFGPTGTGKSLFAICYGIKKVLEGKYKRFIIARPVVNIAEGRTFTSAEFGELYYKIASEYLKDILYPYIDVKEIENLLKEEKVILTDPYYIRGRTFDNSIIFLDDAQNIPPEVSSEILMRVGNDSKLIIAGDPVFQKPMDAEKDGAILMREVLLNEERAVVVDLGLKDIVRPGAKRGVKVFLELRMRKRTLNDEEKKIMEACKIYAPDADIVTVVYCKDLKEKYQLPDYVPDAFIVVKEGHQGRLIGKKGERIIQIEQETGFRIRVLEFTLDFSRVISVIHPVREIADYIADVDFAGPELLVTMRRRIGSFIGPKGAFIRFVDGIMERLMGIKVRVTGE